MREGAGPDALLQVNHPRTPGMFAFAGYDPELSQPDESELWSWDFQVFELLNGGVADLETVRADWFGLLDHGDLRVPVGVNAFFLDVDGNGWTSPR